MLSIAEREARMAAFLQMTFPQYAVVVSAGIGSAARRHGAVRLPEIRFALAAATGDGLLRWSVEFCHDTLDGSRPPTDVDRLVAAVNNAPREHAWRLVPDAAPAPRDGIATWRFALEEAWTPANQTPQALYAAQRDLATLPAEDPPVGTVNFPVYTLIGTPPEIGDVLSIRDAQGIGFLGELIDDSSGLTVELPTQRVYTAPMTLVIHRDGVRSVEAGLEEETEDSGATAFMARSLAGDCRKRLLGAESYQLSLQFALMPQAVRREWTEYLRAHRDRPALALVRRDGRVVEAAVKGYTSECGWSPASRFGLSFDVSESGDFSSLVEAWES